MLRLLRRQGWGLGGSGGGSGEVTRAVAEARSDMAAAERLVDERARLHDAFKRLWNEDAIVQARARGVAAPFLPLNHSVQLATGREWCCSATTIISETACQDADPIFCCRKVVLTQNNYDQGTECRQHS